MKFTVTQIAQMIGGKVEGDGDRVVESLGKIEEGKKGSISFLSNPKYEPYIYDTGSEAVIVKNDFQPKKPVKAALILVDDPYTGFTILLEKYHELLNFAKKGSETPNFMAESAQLGQNVYRGAFSYIGENTKIGNNVKIYPQVYIGDDVNIGDNTILLPGVKIYSGSQIGKHCTFHAGAVIGSDGFGFAPQADGSYKTIPQLGNVIIEDSVSIGANSTIDCATMGSTIIRKGVKLDNLIQIGHNVEIGENTVMAAQTAIAGSSKVGKNCVFAGQVGVVGHIQVPDNTTVSAKAGITKTYKSPGKTISGYPALDHVQFLRVSAHYKNLPDLWDRVKSLEEKIINLPSSNEE